ncbi:MAG TPA: DUF1572 family protein [Planctomycetaceae bacterium]|nr:DUF1572 family protein [Planctomycetaceae bacterium]
MPIEAARPSIPADDATIGGAYLVAARGALDGATRKIIHCLDQLSDDDLSWRQHESHNSIQNLIQHLCGNLRQWIIHGVGGEHNVRNRPSEFSDRSHRSKSELAAMLCDTVEKCDKVLADVPLARLLEHRKIQAFDTTLLAAIFDSVSHFVGHQHQIVYITRLRLGERYQFQWTPASREQGAP